MNQEHARRDECADSVIRLTTVLANVVHRDVIDSQAPVFEDVNPFCVETRREMKSIISRIEMENFITSASGPN
jgi:hypothetical protein